METYKYDIEKHTLEISGKSITALDMGRIEALNPTAVYTINIHHTSITDLPNLFNYVNLLSMFENVDTLNLTNNNLTTIPPTFIGAFPRLKRLDLQNNKIGDISSELFSGVYAENMQNLESINLSNNNLTQIPSDFATLRYLVYIDFSNNKLSALPESLAYYAKLNRRIVINLNNNKFNTIPLFLLKPQTISRDMRILLNMIFDASYFNETILNLLANIAVNRQLITRINSVLDLQLNNTDINLDSFNPNSHHTIFELTVSPVNLLMDDNPLPDIMYSIEQPYTSEDYELLVKYTMQTQGAARDQNEMTKQRMSSVFRGHFNPVVGDDVRTRHASPSKGYTRPFNAKSSFSRMNPGAVNVVYSYLKTPVPTINDTTRNEYSRLKSEGKIGGRRRTRRHHTRRRHRTRRYRRHGKKR